MTLLEIFGAAHIADSGELRPIRGTQGVSLQAAVWVLESQGKGKPQGQNLNALF